MSVTQPTASPQPGQPDGRQTPLDGGGDGIVQLAYVHRESVSHSWVESMRGVWDHDLETGGHRIARKPLNLRGTSGMLAQIRNFGTALFLDRLDHEWLMWIDTDMGFQPTAVAELLAHADPVRAPVVGGLCFAQFEGEYDGMGGHRFRVVPTMYRLGNRVDNGRASFCFYGDYPDDTMVQVGATGGAFILIHRTVLEAVRARFGDHWYDQMYDEGGTLVGEDIAFCARALALGVPVFVHTGIKTSHHKAIWMSEADYLAQEGAEIDTHPEMLRLRALTAHLSAQLTLAKDRPWQDSDGPAYSEGATA